MHDRLPAPSVLSWSSRKTIQERLARGEYDEYGCCAERVSRLRVANDLEIARIGVMLIPRFSLRWLLLLTTLSGLFFFVVARAVAGNPWAIALAVALSATLGTFVLHAIVFGLAWTMAVSWRFAVARKTSSSPFATSAPPPQVIPPEAIPPISSE